MFHKIKSITPLPDYIITVQFSEGVTKTYDMKILFERNEYVSAYGLLSMLQKSKCKACLTFYPWGGILRL